jgi:hypothetical protein
VYAGLAGENEKTSCKIEIGGQISSVLAEGENTTGSHASSQCAGRAIRAHGVQLLQPEITADTYTSNHVPVYIGPFEGNAAVLGGAKFSNTDGADTAFCEVYAAEGGWWLKANEQHGLNINGGDANAECAARLWDLGENVELKGEYDASVSAATDADGKVEVMMTDMREGTHLCFLTKIAITDAKAADEATGCTIFPRNGIWHLRAQAKRVNSLDSAADCRARCLEISGNPFPPKPVRKSGFSGSTFMLYRDRNFNGTHWVNGPYDRPMVFVEGVDPTNRFSTVHYAKEMAIAFRLLQRVGFDIWMLDLWDGGGDLTLNARSVAEIIHQAHNYRPKQNDPSWAELNPGKKFPLMGVSMGGVLTRIALASWEQGIYATGIFAFTTIPDPPISVWISGAGAHYGAQVPLSAQTTIKLAAPFLGTESEPYQAVNSMAAEQMITNRVTQCTVPTWDGDLATLPGFLDDLSTFLHGGVFDVRGTELCKWNGSSCDVEISCSADGLAHQAEYADINSRGVRPHGVGQATGWPQTVPLKVGMSNGSWFKQDCSRMPNGVNCSYFDPDLSQPATAIVPNETALAKITFAADLPEIVNIFLLDDIEASIYIKDQAADLWPGDTAGRSANTLNIVDLKSSIGLLFTQRHPVLGMRTDQALGCPLNTTLAALESHPLAVPLASDGSCQSTNREARRFDYVHSNHERNNGYELEYNGLHDTMSIPLGMRMLAYLYDGRPGGDADGWFSACDDPQAPDATCNPFYTPAIHGCMQDCDETVHRLNNECPPVVGSCQARCGGPSTGCSCDASCTQDGDCCPDFGSICGRAGELASCAGNCGATSVVGPSNAACSCAADCATSLIGCCPDQITFCGPCSDGVVSGSETDVDCGGAACSPCANGQTCAVSADCSSGRCDAGMCVPWSQAFGGGDYDPYSQALALAFDPDGNVVVTGEASGPAELGDVTPAPGVGAFDLFVGKYAPDGTQLWSQLVGSLCNDYGRSVATDQDGSVIVGGSVGCGGSVGGPALPGIEQALVAKYSASGDHLWSKAFGDDGTDEAVMALATLGTGEIVVAGLFEAPSLDFGLEDPITNHGASGSLDIFVAKLTPDGSTVWARSFGGTGQDWVSGLAVDPAGGEVVVTGTLGGAVDFGGGNLSPVGQDMFALRLSSCGEHIWSKRFGGNASSITTSHAVAMGRDGAVFLSGSYSGTLSFGGPTFTSASDDAYLAKLDAGGTLMWSKSFLGSGFDEGRALVVDGHGDLLLAGGFNSSNLDLGGSLLSNASSNFGMDVFVAKFNPVNGNHLFSTSHPSAGDNRGLSLAVHPATGATVLGGMFTDTLDIDGEVMTSAGSFDIFIASLGSLP